MKSITLKLIHEYFGVEPFEPFTIERGAGDCDVFFNEDGELMVGSYPPNGVAASGKLLAYALNNPGAVRLLSEDDLIMRHLRMVAELLDMWFLARSSGGGLYALTRKPTVCKEGGFNVKMYRHAELGPSSPLQALVSEDVHNTQVFDIEAALRRAKQRGK